MAKTNSGLLAYAKAQVGLPYWYGTYGQTATASLYESKKKQYPSYYTDSDFSSQYGKRVHDCVGIIKGYLWSTSATATPVYNSSQDKSASGMYSAATTKGAISTFPKTAGLLVFKGTSTSKITHVGVYDGEGYVYEAKGHSYGVVKTAYKSSDWNYWAQCPYCTDDTSTNSSSNSTASSTKAAATTTADPKTTWTYLLGKIGNAYGVAGLMGNLYAESALIANNLQNSYQSKLGYTDATYTAAVDDGSYTKFSSDSAGYGLAQWTYSTRKANLKSYADSQNASIGNLSMQLGFLYKELSESYSSVLTTLKNATSVKEASDAVLTKFEKPADQSDSAKTKRAEYGQKYYDTYATTSSTTASSSTSTSSTAKTSTSTKFKAGDKVTLKNTALYSSFTATSKSGTKSGTYYIWSAEVSNGRIRITNSTANVGKSGQVTGFVNESDITAATTTTTSSNSTTASSKKPTYTVGKEYTLQTEVNVRKGAGTSYAKVGYSGLSTDGKKHDADKDGALDKGTVVTCQKVTNVGNDIWIKCPSGWLAAYYNGEVYIK